MEKKVPERKVSLREEDIFYVYDKRINKCIKEDCEGVVKYGLVLKVSMTEEETCNCFECNKCHMKYTPYPNYVRLTKTDMLTIYNKDEVDARDRKRAEDAMKQAAREKRKQQGHSRFAPRRDAENGTQGRAYERKPFENRSYNKKPYDKKQYDRKPYEKKAYDRKPYNEGGYVKKSYDRKPYNGEGFEKKSYSRKSFDGKSYDKRTYSSRANGYASNVEGFNGERRNNNVVITNGNYRKPYTNSRRNYGSYQNRYEHEADKKEI